MPQNRLTRHVLTGTVVVVMGLGTLAGCSTGHSDTGPSTVPEHDEPSTTSLAPSAASSSNSAPAGSSSVAARRNNEHLLAAGETALGAVQNGTLVSIVAEQDHSWNVTLVSSDGSTDREIMLSADGTTVTSGPMTKQDSGNTAEQRKLVQAAKLDYTEAVTVATQAVPGSVTALKLGPAAGSGPGAGAAVWEAEVVDAHKTHHKVIIDASTGKILDRG